MGNLIETIPTEVAEAVAESLRLLRQARYSRSSNRQKESQPLPSLLERCEQYIGVDGQPFQEPIRLIHHFACTGGTLIAKCIASMPNTQLLSEVEPHSTIPQQRRSRFAPTDLIGLMRNSSRGSDSELESRVFMAALEKLYEDCVGKGLRLVLRDHAHSNYCIGTSVSRAPNLRRLIRDCYAQKSIVTVRHPLDSWLSLNNNGWVQFQPGSLDEYSARYQTFLDDHVEAPILRYEDFVCRPDQTLQDICKVLNLAYVDDYQKLFSVHRISGDSGRSSDIISARPRRAVPDKIASEAKVSEAYKVLCERLGYRP